ncbi:lysophospholipid acyltransferase family protein [Croceibacterium ferulae]|uniref:lysophospholipid acyltransferase family protein n=1 Tax=Croceibacterium ferulae TaxID=1854641 RepID=UPI000EB32A39|nr:lysophospholipid acyltransferase family protein [Croceibacterium ferulae]
MNLLRSIAFYVGFYAATVWLVSHSLIAARWAPHRLDPVVRRWARSHRWCLRHLAGIQVREEGLQADHPVIYALRHESFFEAIDLPGLLKRPAVFAKRELFDLPGWGRVASAYGLVPVYRDAGASSLRDMLAQAKRRVKDGRPLAIFPEGTRTPHGVIAPLRPGFVGIYKVTGLAIIPVAVNSGPLYRRWIKRPGTITIRFGEPIPPGLPRDEVEARVLAAINVLNEVPAS